jgi:hypothetical protein
VAKAGGLVAVLVGGEDWARGEVTVRDLGGRAQVTVPVAAAGAEAARIVRTGRGLATPPYRGKAPIMSDTERRSLLVAANRGPVQIVAGSGGREEVQRGGGGLVSGMVSALS